MNCFNCWVVRSVCVVIPIYRPQPTEQERKALVQVLQVLGDYPICLVAPKGLETTPYQRLVDAAGVGVDWSFWPKRNFSGLHSYNCLMLSRCFYRAFEVYDFLLIYQLDAWVHRDELRLWMDQPYDYIGAPSYSNGEDQAPWVGNGGFSLRRTAAFLAVYQGQQWYREYVRLSCLHQQESAFKAGIERLWMLWQAFWLKHAPVPVVLRRVRQEDYFWSHVSSLRKPILKIAMAFSIELNRKQLKKDLGRQPFGEHGLK